MGIVGSGPGDREAMTKAYVLAFFSLRQKAANEHKTKRKTAGILWKKMIFSRALCIEAIAAVIHHMKGKKEERE